MSGGNCKPKNTHGEKDANKCDDYLTDKASFQQKCGFVIATFF